MAGPIANFILAILIFTAIFTFYGRQETSATVDFVAPGGAAEQAGFQPGDVIVDIDGSKIANFSDVQRMVSINAGNPLNITVRRKGGDVKLVATPERQEIKDDFGNVQRTGILGIKRDIAAPDSVVTERFSPPEAFVLAVSETWFVTERTLSYIVDVFAGRESADQLGGPLRVAQVSAQVATIGFIALINLAAILSISIGLLNLFPVPMLDGGHLLYYAIEAIRGRPLSERAQDIGFRIGFTAVVMLMIFATWNDIIHLSSL